MSVPIHCGDVIVTMEKNKSRLGAISRHWLNTGMYFDLPKGFVQDAEAALHDQPLKKTLHAAVGAKFFRGVSGNFYDLDQLVEVAVPASEMQWYVKEADADAGRYALMAIGRGKLCRENDWFSFKPKLGADMPPLRDFLEVKDVDDSFFDGKAIIRFASTASTDSANKVLSQTPNLFKGK